MNDRDFENYLALLSGMLRLRRSQRAGISGELRDHLIEHVAHLESTGISHDEAVRRALEEFGDAAALAANFSALVGMRRRRLIMRCTIGTTVVMTGLVVALLAFPPEVIDDPSVAQAQNRQKAGKNSDGGVAGTPTQAKRAANPQNEDAQTREKLASVKMEAEFTETPLSAALAFIADFVEVQFYIDQKSLASASIAPDSRINLNLEQIPAEMVLDLVLRQHGLGYRLRNGVIMVSSEEDIQSQVEVRVYPVPEEDAQELAALIPATIDTNNWREPVHTQMLGGMGGAGMMPGAPGPAGRPGAGEGSFGGGLIGGGGPGTVRVFRGVLVISQTPEVHEQIQKLIADLDSVLADRPRRANPPGIGPHSGGFPGTPSYGEGLPPGARHTGFDSGSGMPRGPAYARPAAVPGGIGYPSLPNTAPPTSAPTSIPSGSPAPGAAPPSDPPAAGPGILPSGAAPSAAPNEPAGPGAPSAAPGGPAAAEPDLPPAEPAAPGAADKDSIRAEDG